jgi:tetraacyldisaccharide 4'-kinase
VGRDGRAAASPALSVASLALAAATRLRRALHGAGLLPTASLPAPVISIGNLAAGGAGKTPLVEHAVRVLRELGARPAVLSRGYGPRVGPSGLNDEGLVLAENLPGLVQEQDADRVAAGRRVRAGGKADCFVLDDAFQHFRLARDLDLVALDARDPFGGGLRREGPRGLARAGAVVLTRAGRAGTAAVDAARRAVARHAPAAVLAVADHEPAAVVPLGGGAAEPPESLRGKVVVACAGIADPSSLGETLQALGARVASVIGFPDHGLSSPAQLADAIAAARLAKADLVVVTQKDAVKLAAGGGAPPPFPVTALRIRVRFLEGEAAIRGALAGALERGRSRGA